MAKSKYNLKLKKCYVPHVFNLHDLIGIAALIWALSFILSWGIDFDPDKGIKMGFESEDLKFISEIMNANITDYDNNIGGIL